MANISSSHVTEMAFKYNDLSQMAPAPADRIRA